MNENGYDEHMKKILLALPFITLLSGCGATTRPLPKPQTQTTSAPATAPTSTIEKISDHSDVRSIDSEWNEYTNHDLGISIQFPKKIYSEDWSFSDGMIYPLHVIENGEVLTFSMGRHQSAFHTDKNGHPIQINEDLSIRHPYYSATYLNDEHYPAQIYLAKATSTQALNAFAARTYGAGCVLDGPSWYEDRPGIETFAVNNAPHKKCPGSYDIGDVVTWNQQKGVAIGIQPAGSMHVQFDKPNAEIPREIIITGMNSEK
jgi:hypothetical protein